MGRVGWPTPFSLAPASLRGSSWLWGCPVEEEDRTLGGQPATYGGPKSKNWEDMGPKPCWWTRGVGRRLIPRFHTHTAQASFSQRLGSGCSCLLPGRYTWLCKSPRGPGWASDERRRESGGFRLAKQTAVPFQVSPMLNTLYHRSLFSLTTEGKEADVQSQNHIQEKRLDT